jgi:hypothetical protein
MRSFVDILGLRIVTCTYPIQFHHYELNDANIKTHHPFFSSVL